MIFKFTSETLTFDIVCMVMILPEGTPVPRADESVHIEKDNFDVIDVSYFYSLSGAEVLIRLKQIDEEGYYVSNSTKKFLNKGWKLLNK